MVYLESIRFSNERFAHQNLPEEQDGLEADVGAQLLVGGLRGKQLRVGRLVAAQARACAATARRSAGRIPATWSLRSMRGTSSLQHLGILQLAGGGDVEQQLVRHAAPQEVGQPRSQRIRVDAAQVAGVVRRLGTEQEMRRNQRAAEGEENGRLRTPGPVSARPGTAPGTARYRPRRRDGGRRAGRKFFRISRAAWSGETPVPGLGHENLRAGFVFFGREVHGELRGFHVLFGMQRREEQRFGRRCRSLRRRRRPREASGRCPSACRDRSRTVAVYSSRFRRRMGEGPGAMPAAQVSARSVVSTQCETAPADRDPAPARPSAAFPHS